MNTYYTQQEDSKVPDILEKYANYRLINLDNLGYGLTIISHNITQDVGYDLKYTKDFLIAASELIDFKGYVCTYGIEENTGILGNKKHYFYIYKHDTLSFKKLLDRKIKDNKIVFYIKKKYYNTDTIYEGMLKKYCINNGYNNFSLKKRYSPFFIKYIVTLS